MVPQNSHLILCIGFHRLGSLVRFVHLSFYLSFRSVHALSHFPVISLRQSPVSGIYIAVVILT
jgi:hypothetical protein